MRLPDGSEVAIASAVVSPLPSADELAILDRLVPGAAAQLMSELRLEGDARRTRDDLLLRAHIDSRTRAQWMAFSLAVSFVALAALAVVYNQPWVAGFVGAVGFGHIIVALLKDGGIGLPGGPKRED